MQFSPPISKSSRTTLAGPGGMHPTTRRPLELTGFGVLEGTLFLFTSGQPTTHETVNQPNRELLSPNFYYRGKLKG